MKKTLYSLMLNDEVVREVDALAHRMGTSRSSLYKSDTCGIRQLYHAREADKRRALRDRATYGPVAGAGAVLRAEHLSMSLKSSLEYKYRPTVKYEVALTPGDSEAIGELSVVFRTQSAALISAMTDFFRIWKDIEDRPCGR